MPHYLVYLKAFFIPNYVLTISCNNYNDSKKAFCLVKLQI